MVALDAEQALAASEHRLAAQSRTLTALTERWATGTFDERVNEVLRMAAATMDVARLSVWCFPGDIRSIECLAHYQNAAPRGTVGSRIGADDCPAYFQALAAERVIAAHDAHADPRTAAFTGWYLEPNRIGAMLDVPLRHSGGMLGVLCAEHVGGARTWTLDEQNFAIAVANLIAVAMADAERSRALARLAESEARATAARAHAERSRDQLDRELTRAGDMQRMILPRSLPVHDRVRFAASYQTSRHAGGDYYDVIPIDANRFAVVVADVSGHGANAAIVMAMIRTAVHACQGPLDDPRALLQHLNRHFCYLWDTEIYATAVVAVLDLAAHVIRVSSAGHPPPVVIHHGNVTSFPTVNCLPLFWTELGDIPVVESRCERGDRLVFYTDGLPDRRGPGDTMFEMSRLMAAVAGASRLDLAAMVDALTLELECFAGAVEPDDDQTVLAIEAMG